MFRTTLVNLSPDATQASPDFGPRSLGTQSRDEVRALLEQFRTLDAVANAKADPEILLETRREKHLIRTGQNRLYLYDPRDALAPALVLSVDEIIAELDGTAAAARTRAPFVAAAAPADEGPTPVRLPPPRTTLRSFHRLALGLIAVCSASYLVFALSFTDADSPPDEFQLLADEASSERARTELSGVYMTGTNPGAHGVALAADGKLKLFQNNDEGAPSLIRDTYRVGKLGTQIAVRGTSTKVTLRFESAGLLTTGGETYRRVP
jgi:hypothetical protein